MGDLSQGGKEVMIKFVAQAVMTYIICVFKLPFSIRDELTKIIHDYWWGADRGKWKTHWMNSEIWCDQNVMVESVFEICTYIIRSFSLDRHGGLFRNMTVCVPVCLGLNIILKAISLTRSSPATLPQLGRP
jgi:hypothetical protein